MSNVKDALAAASQTRALIIGKGVLNQVAKLFIEQFPGKKAVVIADYNTYEIAGKTVQQQLQQASIKQFEPFIYTDPNLCAAYEFVQELIDFLATHDAIPIAVGSGTINDLTKLASHLTNRQYLCVATAASMDGYTAFGASITANGVKQTYSCPAPQACLADIDILCKAPSAMTAAGYADLFAKVTAGADWILADSLGIEPIDQKAWSIVQGGLQDALSDPDGVRNGHPAAIEKLVEGLMLAGFAMQSLQSSRPASGAEHQFSHLWNMENHLNNGEHISHGFQVSMATLAITRLYEVFLNSPMHELDVEKCVNEWPLPAVADAAALKIFEGSPFPEIGLQETRAKYNTKEEVAAQLNLLKNNWTTIKAKLSAQLIPYTEAKRRLDLVGAPTAPAQIGMTLTHLRETFIRAQFIRRRFTILDVTVRTGHLAQWLAELFENDGAWGANAE
jgi:glycerol-1-phosphate dehydrogenase [NAD(P)+]